MTSKKAPSGTHHYYQPYHRPPSQQQQAVLSRHYLLPPSPIPSAQYATRYTPTVSYNAAPSYYVAAQAQPQQQQGQQQGHQQPPPAYQIQLTAQQQQSLQSQTARDFSTDSYLYDLQRSQSKVTNTDERGSLLSELLLIPLAKSTMAKPDDQKQQNDLLSQNQILYQNGVIYQTQNQNGVVSFGSAAASSTSQNTGISFKNVPRMLLGTDQDSYLAGIAVMYQILLGLMPGLSQALQDSCKAFNTDYDSISVTESQLETLLYNFSLTQSNTMYKQLLVPFPLHERYMSLPLRTFVYQEIVHDKKSGERRALATLDPFNWRHALPSGESAFRKYGEIVDAKELDLRRRYHGFLIKLYSMIWRSVMRLRAEQSNLYNKEHQSFVEKSLQFLQPASQSVRILESRILALISRLQLDDKVMFNTAQFYIDADQLKNIMHPELLKIISQYLYFKAI